MKQSEVVMPEVVSPQSGQNDVLVVKKGYLSTLKKEMLGSAEALSGSENIVLRKLGKFAGGALTVDYSSGLESKSASRITANFYLNKLRLEMAMPQSEWRKFVRDSHDLQETMLDLFDIRVAEGLIRKSTVDFESHVSLTKEEIECFVKSVFFSSSYEKMTDRLLAHIFNVSDQDASNVIWGFFNKKLIKGERIIEHIVVRGEAFLGVLSQFLYSLDMANKQSVIDNFRSRVLMGEPLIQVLRDLQFAFNLPIESLQQLKDIMVKNPYNVKMLEVGVLLLMEHEKSYRPSDDSVALSKQVSNTVWGLYSKVRRAVTKRSSRIPKPVEESPSVAREELPSLNGSQLIYMKNKEKGEDGMNLAKGFEVGVQSLYSKFSGSSNNKRWSDASKREPIQTQSTSRVTPTLQDTVVPGTGEIEDTLGFDLDALLAPTGYSLAPNKRKRDLKHYFTGLPPLNQLTLSKYHMALQNAKSDGLVIRAQ